MYQGLGVIIDPGLCNTFGIFCGDGSGSYLPGIPNPPKPAPAAVVPGAYDTGGFLTGDPQALINATIDPSAAQDRLNIANWFGQVNAANVAGENPSPLGGTFPTLAVLAIGAVALFALVKR